MLLINYGHPFTDAQVRQIINLLGFVPEFRHVPVQIDHGEGLRKQIDDLIDRSVTAEELNSSIILNLPGLSLAAVALMVGFYSRLDYFPRVLRLRPVPGAPTFTFEADDIIDFLE